MLMFFIWQELFYIFPTMYISLTLKSLLSKIYGALWIKGRIRCEIPNRETLKLNSNCNLGYKNVIQLFIHCCLITV